LENRKVEQVLSGGIGTSGREVKVGKWCRKVNMVKILCTHVFKWKMIPVETIPRMGRGRIKDNDGGGELNYDIFDTL
jgi:hypothetical protein